MPRHLSKTINRLSKKMSLFRMKLRLPSQPQTQTMKLQLCRSKLRIQTQI